MDEPRRFLIFAHQRNDISAATWSRKYDSCSFSKPHIG